VQQNQKFTEHLKYQFSDSEIAEMAKESARASKMQQSIELRQKEIVSQLKADIALQQGIVVRLSGLIDNGFEYRMIECRVELDSPEPGKKRIIRNDTGEEVAVKAMTDTDRQMVLDLQEKAQAQEDAEQAKKEPIITPPPFPTPTPIAIAEPEIMSAADVAAENGAPLASVIEMGGSHQKGTRKERNKRNPAAEAVADGSASSDDVPF